MSNVIETIFPTNMKEEVEQSFLDYALSVITDRALPDVRDGLKPVHRRIIYTMFEKGLTSSKAYKKSADTVGSVLGSYHPHGDTSVYDAMVRLAQDFSMRYTLVDGHGNFGNIDGDPAAAYRYTEARMSKVAEEMIRDIKKNTVNFKPNFSEDKMEPIVLPSRLPNLIINGTTGIAVGMACSFAPHNLTDTFNAIVAYVNNNEITHKELLDIVTGPDFPTGGLVINQDELLEGYSTGRGRIRIRSRYKLETRGKKQLVVFTEIPYMTKKEKIIQDIVKLCESKTIEGISDVRDESDDKIALVIEIAKGFNPDDVARVLYAKTQLEDTYSINHVCLVDGMPRILSFKELIAHYVEFQREVLTRRTQFELDKILARINIINGLVIALANIDDVIALIKASNSTADAQKVLMQKFILNEIQAKAVTDMRLAKLTKMEVEELKSEREGLTKEKNRLEGILNSNEELNKLFIGELTEIKNKFKSPRRTEITQINIVKDKKVKPEFIPKPITIAINEDYTIKIIESKQFKNKKNTDNYLYILETNTGHSLAVFAEDGKVYRIPLHDVQDNMNIISSLGLDNVKIIDILTETKGKYVVFLTKSGMIKKTSIEEYQDIKRNGVIGIKLKENDKVAKICYITDEQLIIASENGMTIRIDTKDISATGRNTMGVAGIKLKGVDHAISMAPVNKEYILTITKNGYAKKTIQSDYITQGRNGVGTIGCKISELDKVISVLCVNDTDKIMIYSDNTLIKIPCTDVPSVGRIAQGNHIAKYGNVNNINII